MRYHNVTTRDSLALLLKVKIPVGAGAILRRASPQVSSRLPFFLFLSSSLKPLPSLSLSLLLSPSFALFSTRSIYVLMFFFSVNSYKRLLARYSVFITAAGSNRV